MQTCNCNPDFSAASELTLAMATVPIQLWETPYAPEKALRQGTIFPELDKPFYIVADALASTSGFQDTTAAGYKTEPHELQQLQALDFMITDLMLYMDTHPDDSNAKETLNQLSEQYSSQKRDTTGKPHFAWSDGPLPWDHQTASTTIKQGGAK